MLATATCAGDGYNYKLLFEYFKIKDIFFIFSNWSNNLFKFYWTYKNKFKRKEMKWGRSWQFLTYLVQWHFSVNGTVNLDMDGEPRLIELGFFVAYWLVLVYSMNTDTISMLYSRNLV